MLGPLRGNGKPPLHYLVNYYPYKHSFRFKCSLHLLGKGMTSNVYNVYSLLLMQQGQEDSDDYSEADLGPLDGSSTQQLEEYPWVWGWMSREDCERKLHAEGEVGNFVVRINAMGDYVMSL